MYNRNNLVPNGWNTNKQSVTMYSTSLKPVS